jgi:hypothetical protein
MMVVIAMAIMIIMAITITIIIVTTIVYTIIITIAIATAYIEWTPSLGTSDQVPDRAVSGCWPRFPTA